jgi:hypothetical protein
VEGEVGLAKGLYRVVAQGEMTIADGNLQSFIVRGPFVRVEWLSGLGSPSGCRDG